VVSAPASCIGGVPVFESQLEMAILVMVCLSPGDKRWYSNLK